MILVRSLGPTCPRKQLQPERTISSLSTATLHTLKSLLACSGVSILYGHPIITLIAAAYEMLFGL